MYIIPIYSPPPPAEIVAFVMSAELTQKTHELKLADSQPVENEEVDSASENEAGEATGDKKKKKKKNSKKKKKKGPPSTGISHQFQKGVYPEGEICEYAVTESLNRMTSEEKRALEIDHQQQYNDLRKAAEVHRQVRTYARNNIKPGMLMTDIAEMIENSTQSLAEGDTWKSAGTGFPTGLSLNDCAAHWTPNKGDKTILQESDVLKVDFGVHVNGNIIDSAWTMTFQDQYDPLVAAVSAATNEGVKQAGIDVRLGDIGAAIQEVMESYEVEINGKTYPVKAIKNLCGHNIAPYTIHSGKSVPIVASPDQTKMEEGEVFAIETFGSTGRGYVVGQGEVSHYARSGTAGHQTLRLASAKQLLNVIDNTFGTLPFCRRYLDKIGQDKYLLALNNLVKAGVVTDYPPLMDAPNSYTAQLEHTIILRPTCKEVLSRGNDY